MNCVVRLVDLTDEDYDSAFDFFMADINKILERGFKLVGNVMVSQHSEHQFVLGQLFQ